MEQVCQKTVTWTRQNGLCISCGLCKNVCPRSAIEYEREKGKFLPRIDETRCVQCSFCTDICPGLSMDFPERENVLDSMYGQILSSYNAWSSDPILRHASASGGVVSSLIEILLKDGEYDAAFCVTDYNYENQLKTKLITCNLLPVGWENSTIPKSRYLPVSHEEAVAFMRSNPEKRVILIGTSCAIQGFRKLIRRQSQDTSRYLLIGLFCDKVFNYNVNDYYQQHFSPDKKISSIHFKNKESGGWPGNMKLFFEDGSEAFLNKSERAKMKDYFMPERCLYCIDKLNVTADISIGDNYTDQNNSSLGSNTVLLRTQQGEKAWNIAGRSLVYEPVDYTALRKAQYLDGRANNLYFSEIKHGQIHKETGAEVHMNQRVSPKDRVQDYEFAYKRAIKKIRAGEVYREKPKELDRQLRLERQRKQLRKAVVLAKRLVNAVKSRK